MKEVLISLFSGIIGVILTIVYQHFFSPPQSFTFIYNGEEMVVTESTYTEIIEENESLNNEIIKLQHQLEDQQKEINKQNLTDEIIKTIQTATDYWNDSNYIQCLTLLKNSKSKSTDIESLYIQYSDEYCLNLLEQADMLIEDMKYEEAIDLIDNSLILVYDNSILNRRIEDIKSSKPQNLIDKIKPYEKNGYTEKIGSDYMQMGGNKYYNGFQLGDGYEISYALFNLNGNYNKITCTIGHIDESGDVDKTILIIGDNNIIETIEINHQSLPKEFTINVKGVSQLKFEREVGRTQTAITNIIIQ